MDKYFTKLEQDGELYTIPKTEHIIAPNNDGYNTLYSIWQPSLPDPSVDINTLTKKQLQTIVRLGKAADYFKAHETQITCKKGTTTLIWDVLGIDVDTPTDTRFTHSVTLGLHYAYDTHPFDPKQAAFYFPNGLAAGTYNFTVIQQPYYAGDINKTFQFTTTIDIPSGGQFVLGNAYNATIDGSLAYTYGGATKYISAIETVTMSEGNGGTFLGSLTDSINGNVNSIERILLGGDNYRDSAIRQYLTTTSESWQPQTVWSRPPTWSNGNWIHDIDKDFVDIIGPVNKVTANNTITDGGGWYTTSDKFWLLSSEEIYGDGNDIEGFYYPYYSQYSSLSSAGNGADTNRVKYNLSDVASRWWTRSPYILRAGVSFAVSPTGSIGGINDSSLYNVSPACCIV